VVRFRSSSVAIPASRLPLVRLLLERLGTVVKLEELSEAAAAAGSPCDGRALAVKLRRTSTALASVDLHLHNVRRRGWMLTVASPDRSGGRVAERPACPDSGRPRGVLIDSRGRHRPDNLSQS
jgi:hypothetical protein